MPSRSDAVRTGLCPPFASVIIRRNARTGSAAVQTVFALHDFTFSLAIGFASAAGYGGRYGGRGHRCAAGHDRAVHVAGRARMVCVHTLRARGDQVAAGVNGAIAFFAVTGGPGSLLVARGTGAPALIVAFVSGLLAAAVSQGGRLRRVNGRMRRG